MFGEKTVSIDIGSKNIHIVEVVRKGNLTELHKIVEFPTPTNSYIEGRIEDMSALKEAVRAALSQYKIRSKDAVLSVQGTASINRELVLPETKNEQLGGMVRYEMEQYLPDAIDNYTVEFRVLGKVSEDGVSKLKIRATAMTRETVDSYFKLVNELRLRPLALDTHLNSISKLFQKPVGINSEKYDTSQTISVIDFGNRNTVINIISGGMLEFSRPVPYGSRDLDTALAARFDIPIDRAEQKKIQELRLDRLEDDAGAEEDIGSIVRPILQQWMSEVQKVFQYYINRNPEKNRISAVYLYGGGANQNGLSDYMMQYLGINTVQKISRIEGVKIKNGPGDTDIGGCLNAVGAAIRL